MILTSFFQLLVAVLVLITDARPDPPPPPQTIRRIQQSQLRTVPAAHRKLIVKDENNGTSLNGNGETLEELEQDREGMEELEEIDQQLEEERDEQILKDEHLSEGSAFLVDAQELEITITFVLILPSEKKYDSTELRSDNDEMEAPPVLGQAWSQFIKHVMEVTADIQSIALLSKTTSSREEDKDFVRHLQILNNTVEWIQDSPSIYDFLITTECQTDQNILQQKHDEEQHALDTTFQTVHEKRKSSIEATCYQAFGKFRILQLFPLLGSNKKEFEDQDDVCQEIWELVQEGLEKGLLEHHLLLLDPKFPFLISKDESSLQSCIPTGFATQVPLPSSDQPPRTTAAPTLPQQQQSWYKHRLLMLMIYVATCVWVLFFITTGYCFILPKVQLAERNRVTTDDCSWSSRPPPSTTTFRMVRVPSSSSLASTSSN